MNIEQHRKLCLAFPGATPDGNWGNDLCVSVAGTMFSVTAADSSDAGVSLKTTPEKFAELTERAGVIPAHYVARYHWITIEDLNAVTKTELKDLIRESYSMVFAKLPAKVKKAIAGA
jgi:predicted DNA-binding protein (MmcQ/YjbR family)